MARQNGPDGPKSPAEEGRRWRRTRARPGPINAIRRFLSNAVSVRTLRLAHQRAAPVRLLMGAAVGLLWLGLGASAAYDEMRQRLDQPGAERAAAQMAPGSPEYLVTVVSDSICRIRSGKLCDFNDPDIRFVVAQTAFALLAIMTLAFGFWTQLLGAVAHALRAIGAGHVIVTGEGVEAEALARDIARPNRPRRKAVVLLRRNVSSAEVDALAADGVALSAGSPTDRAVLTGAGVRAADRIVAISAGDSENLGVAATALNLRKRSAPGDVLVRLESEALRRDLPAGGRLHAADMFSLPEVAARQVLAGVLLFEEAARRGHNRLHLAVVGWDEAALAVTARFFRLGWALGLEAPRVSVFARDPQAAGQEFQAAYPAANEDEFWKADITFNAYDWRAQRNPWAPLNDVAGARGPFTAALVSWPSDEETLRCAAVLCGRGAGDAPPLIVRESKEETIAITLESARGVRVIPFAQPRQVLSAGALVDRGPDEAARRLHEGYIHTCVLFQHADAYAAALRKGRTLGQKLSRMTRPSSVAGDDIAALESEFAETFGDDALSALRAGVAQGVLERGAFIPSPDGPAQRPWDELSEVYISANRTSADHAVIKLWSLGWRPAGAKERGALPTLGPDEIPDAAADLEHRRWCADMLMSGWRRGARDDRAMLHPDLRDLAAFEGADLESARRKDRDPWFAAPAVAARMFPRLFVRK